MASQNATVLHARLSGLAGIASDLSIDDFNAFLHKFYELLKVTASLYKGKLADFSSDSLIVVFLDEEGALHAVEAIHEYQEQLQAYLEGQKLHGKIKLKAGIANGKLVVGNIEDEKGTQINIMGEALDFAKRLTDFADDGKIMVNKAVHDNANIQWGFKKLEPILIKGSKDKLGVFELKSKKNVQVKSDVYGERKIDSVMIGRIAELELIEHRLKEMQSGNGSVINIVGKAGIGKSRLIAEVTARTVFDKYTLLQGRALSMGSNLSFYPIINIIKSWSDIKEEDSQLISSDKLHKLIERVARENTDEIYPFVATMMGIQLSGKYKDRVEGIEGEALEKLILKNLRDLIIIASRIRPLVIIVEDLHWIDQSSLTFLESLYKLTEKHKVTFINVLRPGYENTSEYILKYIELKLPEQNNVIKLHPLSSDEAATLISNLIHKARLPVDIAQMIISKTEGNPFFIEEVIRSFIDDGVLEVKGEEFLVTDLIGQANIPESINEVILSRVDKLDEKTKELLKTASVIGRNFYYKVLEEATDTISELDDRLTFLKDVQLIREDKKKDEIEFLFKHALAQQLTYDSILQDSRAKLHLKIAGSIEKVFADNIHDYYGTLAYHYEKAKRSDKTEYYLIKAGDEALKTAASAEAIQHYEKALELIKGKSLKEQDSKKITEIEERLAYAFFAHGQNRKAVDLFAKVLSSLKLPFIPSNRFRLLLKMIFCLIRLKLRIKMWKGNANINTDQEDNRILKLLLFQAEAIATYSPRDAFFRTTIMVSQFPLKTVVSSDHGIGCLIAISVVFPWTGRLIGYGKMLNSFVWSVMDNQNTLIWLSGKYTNSMFDYFSGQLMPEEDDGKVLQLSMETGQIWAPTIYHAYKGVAYVEMGMKLQAEQMLEKLHQTAEELENSFTWTQYYRLQFTLYLKFGKFDEIIDRSDKVINFIDQTDHRSILLLIHCITSIAYSHTGKIENAKYHEQEAQKLSKALWLKYYISFTLIARSYILLNELELIGGKSPAIVSDLMATSKMLVKTTGKVYCNKAEAYRLRAIAYTLAKNPSKAMQFFNKSIEFAEWYGSKLELSRTYYELGKYLSDSKNKFEKHNGNSADEYLEKAKVLSETCGLQ